MRCGASPTWSNRVSRTWNDWQTAKASCGWRRARSIASARTRCGGLSESALHPRYPSKDRITRHARRSSLKPLERRSHRMKQDSIISPNTAAVRSAEIRLEKQDWHRIGSDLNSFGCALIATLITRDARRVIAALYPDEDFFPSHIHVSTH